MRWPVLVSHLLVLTTPFVLACESDQMKRGREFVDAEEYEPARQEFRVELKNNPNNTEAKALMVFMDLADPAMRSDAIAQCVLLEVADVKAKSTAAEEAIQAARLKVRKGLLDRGIETRDWKEYIAVLREAVQYGWKGHDYSAGSTASRLPFAFCSALEGVGSAADYLVEHLADSDAREDVEELLYLLADRAEPALRKSALDKESLSAAAAEETLRTMGAARLFVEALSNHKDLQSPSTMRTDSGNEAVKAGRFLSARGWADDNKAIQPVADALSTVSHAQTTLGLGEDSEKEKPVIRLAEVSNTHLAFLTVALPVAQAPIAVAMAGGLQPAGVGTTYSTQAWRWRDLAWLPISIDGRTSLSGSDQVLLAVKTSKDVADLGPDQVLLLLYRGVEEREQVVQGWYFSQTVRATVPRLDEAVYHHGDGGLEFVKILNAPVVQ